MTNKEIVGKIKYYSKLLELHGENDFKIRTYQNAIANLERVKSQICSMEKQELEGIDGIGKGMVETIFQLSANGSFENLDQLEELTPSGILELMNFRGISTKKLRVLWQEFNISDKIALKALLASGKLLSVKGFGAKTIANLAAVVDYAIESEGKIYYAQAEKIASTIIEALQSELPDSKASTVGKLRRKWEVVSSIEILIDQSILKLSPILDSISLISQDKKKSGPFSWKGQTVEKPLIEVVIYPTTSQKFSKDLILKTGSPEHLNQIIGDQKFQDIVKANEIEHEEDYYAGAGLQFCDPEIREGDWEINLAASHNLPELLKTSDLRGILHNHSTYSDGANSLREMAEACKNLGYEYLGMSDHSKAASFYANGLFEERVAQQQKEIDDLNEELKPFKIFKSIESDILADGSLDYDNETLKSFDFVIASIHSGLSMDKNKATERLITAIANPYTTILGHMTGRILLQRQGYPVDHEAIINACAEYGVIIEINAHPKRLDIDWRWVRKALDKGVMLSINPDAHEIVGYQDMYYGVCVGRKGGLTKEQTLNTMSLKAIETYFAQRKSLI